MATPAGENGLPGTPVLCPYKGNGDETLGGGG
jgi:hypothetical protein